jgi:hypothetical protein
MTFFAYKNADFGSVFKGVKYFSISMISHDIKPMTSQTKKTELSIMPIA